MSTPPYPPPPPDYSNGCDTSDGGLGSIACYPTDVSGDSLVSSLIINVILGLLCYSGFVLWRGSFMVYHGREYLEDERKPPKMRLGGHWQIWSWLIPTWNVTDIEFLRSAGLDALVAVRINAFGIALFFPFTVLGIAVLLPVNYTGGYLDSSASATAGTSTNLTTTFNMMTMSNIKPGSNVLWVHFVLLCTFLAWAFYLLLVFYEEHIAMRHTIASESVEHANHAVSKSSTAGDTPIAATKGEDQDDDTNPIKRNPSSPSSEHAQELDSKPRTERLFELWPIRQLGKHPPMRSYQPHLGSYAVLVIDEPPRRFSVSRSRKILGMPISIKQDVSLDDVQQETDRMSQFFWQQGNVTKKTSKEKADGQKEKLGGISTHMSRFVGDIWSKGFGEQAITRKKRNIEARMMVIDSTFRRLFGDDYDRLVPVFPTEKMDACLAVLLNCQARVARAQLALDEAISAHQATKDDAKASKLARKIEKLRANLSKLQDEEASKQRIAEETRLAIINGTPCQSFFAIFRSSKAAAMATELNCNPLHWRAFRIVPAPDPENINFPAIQRSFWHRQWKSLIAIFLIIFMMLLPIGLITGIFSQLSAALCGGSNGSPGSLTGTWFCSNDFWASLIRSVVTSLLPSILMTVYQAVILPMYIVLCCQAESRYVSLSDLDRRAASLFFTWNMANYFLGALLGGTIINGLRDAIENPRSIVSILGTAVPASSNFFISYVMYRALVMTSFRLFYPHACVFFDICKWLRVLPRPRTEMDKARANPLRNCRYSRDLAIPVGTVYIAALAYCVIAPYILPFALIFFVLNFFVYRYQQLYVYQPMYNCRGQYWTFMAHRIIACLVLTVIFSGIMFFVKHAYVQGGLAIGLLFPACLAFDRYLTVTYDSIYKSLPVALLEASPRLEVDQQAFIAAPLRPGAAQWFLNWGTVWEFFGINRYNL